MKKVSGILAALAIYASAASAQIQASVEEQLAVLKQAFYMQVSTLTKEQKASVKATLEELLRAL